jgi:hypothetical protein
VSAGGCGEVDAAAALPGWDANHDAVVAFGSNHAAIRGTPFGGIVGGDYGRRGGTAGRVLRSVGLLRGVNHLSLC